MKTGGNVNRRESSSMACCQAASAEKDVATFEAEEQRDVVKEYYGKELQKTEDLKTSACCTAKPPSRQVRSILAKVPDEVMSKYYGCGSVRRWYIYGDDDDDRPLAHCDVLLTPTPPHPTPTTAVPGGIDPQPPGARLGQRCVFRIPWFGFPSSSLRIYIYIQGLAGTATCVRRWWVRTGR